MKLRKNQSVVLIPTVQVDWWTEVFLTHRIRRFFITFSFLLWDLEVDLSHKI